MYALQFKKNTSKNFKKALKCALFLGGEFDGETVTISVKEHLTAYNTLFPLFKYKIFDWKDTKAFYNGTQVEPYRFIFLADLKRKQHYEDVISQLDTTKASYTFYKREGSRFFFKNGSDDFDIDLSGKELYDFVNRFDVGDEVVFD